MPNSQMKKRHRMHSTYSTDGITMAKRWRWNLVLSLTFERRGVVILMKILVHEVAFVTLCMSNLSHPVCYGILIRNVRKIGGLWRRKKKGGRRREIGRGGRNGSIRIGIEIGRGVIETEVKEVIETGKGVIEEIGVIEIGIEIEVIEVIETGIERGGGKRREVEGVIVRMIMMVAAAIVVVAVVVEVVEKEAAVVQRDVTDQSHIRSQEVVVPQNKSVTVSSQCIKSVHQ